MSIEIVEILLLLNVIEIVLVISIRLGKVWLLRVIAPSQQGVLATRLGDVLRLRTRSVPVLGSGMDQSKQVVALLSTNAVELDMAEILVLVLSLLNLVLIITALTQIVEVARAIHSPKPKLTVLCEIFLLFAPPLCFLFGKIWVIGHREADFGVRIGHLSIARHQWCTWCTWCAWSTWGCQGSLCTWLAGRFRFSLAVVVWSGNLT